MTWSVIHFIKDNSVEVVPHFWFNSLTGLCAWPNQNLSYSVENKVLPNKKEFTYFKARVCKGCEKIDSLLEATKKCERAQYISDVDGSSIKKKYKPKKKTKCIDKASVSSSSLSCASESELDSNVPQYISDSDHDKKKVKNYATKLQLFKTEKHKSSSKKLRTDQFDDQVTYQKKLIEKSPKRMNSKTSDTPLKCSGNSIDCTKSDDQTSSVIFQPPLKKSQTLSSPLGDLGMRTKCQERFLDDFMTSINSTEKKLTGSTENPRKEDLKTAKKKLFGSPTKSPKRLDVKSPMTNHKLIGYKSPKGFSTSKSPLKKNLKNFSDADIKLLMKNQLIVKYEVKSLNEKVDAILKILERIEEGKSVRNADSTYDYASLDCLFPIDNENDLNSLDNQLKSDVIYQEKMVKDLSFTGGADIQHVIRRIMRRLFSDTLLKDYSFGGKGIHKKKCFADLTICKVIFDSIRRIHKFENCSQHQLEDKLKCHLAQAPFRIKRSTK